MAAKAEFVGSISVDSIRDVLIGGKRLEEAIADIQKRASPQKTAVAGAPVAWFYSRYNIGRPTCVKIGRLDAWDRPRPAIQLFFDRSRSLLKGTQLTQAVSDAVYGLLEESKSYGKRRPSKIQISNATAKALKPFLDKGRWHVEPFLLTPKFLRGKDRIAATVTDHWVELLLGWVETVYKNQCTDDDFALLVRRYNEHGPGGFFASPKLLKFWHIVSRWDNWKRAGAGMVDVQNKLKELGIELRYEALWRLCYNNLKLDKLSGDEDVDDPHRSSVWVSVVDDAGSSTASS